MVKKIFEELKNWFKRINHNKKIMEEKFCTINEAPNYKISNTGKLWSNYVNRELKPCEGFAGYHKHSLTCADGNDRSFYISRLVAEYFIPGFKKSMLVDHKDRNIYNNNVSNLRLSNRSTNGMNRECQCNNTTGYKGVSFYKNRYQAEIRKNGKRY